MLDRRTIFAALLVCLLAPRNGAADLPEPPNVVTPAGIALVGTRGGAADPAGAFTVVVRDLANLPIPSSVVIVDFSDCPDLWICDQQPANLVANPAARTITAVTNPLGEASFVIVGGGRAVATPASSLTVRLIVDGVIFPSIPVRCYDLDNAAGVNGADLTLWLDDFGRIQPAARSDYNYDGIVGGADLTLWLDLFGGGGSVASCAGTSF